MHIYKKLLLIPLLALANSIHAMESSKESVKKLLVIDTGNNPAYACQNVQEMARGLGFQTSFQQGYQVDINSLDDFSAFVVNLDPLLVKHRQDTFKDTAAKPHPYAVTTTAILQKLGTLKNKSIVVSLPSVALSNPDAVTEEMLRTHHTTMQESAPLLKEYLSTFKVPDHRRKFQYSATLFAAGKNELSKEYLEAQETFKNNQQPNVSALPTQTDQDAEELKPLWPLGVAWQEPNSKQSLLLTRDSYLNCADVSENFMLCPLDEPLRTKLQAAVYRMLQQFLQGAQTAPTSLPFRLTSSYDAFNKREILAQRSIRTYAPSHAWLKEKPTSCAWMSVKEFQAQGAQSIDVILHSGIKILWLDLIPEIFLSCNARCGNNKELFLSQVEWFTKNLKERAEVLKKPLPLICMGTDVTLNYKTMPNCPVVPVENPTVNMYGKVLDRIPSPIDVNGFWQTQVIDVINAFVDAWDSRIGNGVPLSGIFFDLEMYQAQTQASSYEDTMDYSDLAWNMFLSKHPQKESPKLHTVAERVDYLLTTQQMDTYLSYLHKQAKKVGKLVHACIKKRLPNGIIGVYNANMPSSWFYRGFIASLSSPEEPVIGATFNTTFYKHAPWLENQGVFMHHLQVLMLSKLRTQEDFKQIDTIFKNNDGVWLNRLSRLVEKEPNNELESSPLTPEQMADGLSKHLHAHK